MKMDQNPTVGIRGCDAVDGGQEPGGGGEGEAGGGSGGGHGGLGADGAADLDRVAAGAKSTATVTPVPGAQRLPGDRGRRRRGRRCRSGQQRRRDEQQARATVASVRRWSGTWRFFQAPFSPGNERGAHRAIRTTTPAVHVGSGETARSPGAQGVSVPAPGDRHGAPCGTPGPTLHSSTEGATPRSASVRLASQSDGTRDGHGCGSAPVSHRLPRGEPGVCPRRAHQESTGPGRREPRPRTRSSARRDRPGVRGCSGCFRGLYSR